MYSIGLRRKGIRATCTRFRNWSYTRVQREWFVQNVPLMDYCPWHITNIVFSHSLCDYPYRRWLGNDHLANQGKHVDVVHLVTLSMVPNDVRRDNTRKILRVVIDLLYGAYSFGRYHKYELLSLFRTCDKFEKRFSHTQGWPFSTVVLVCRAETWS